MIGDFDYDTNEDSGYNIARALYALAQSLDYELARMSDPNSGDGEPFGFDKNMRAAMSALVRADPMANPVDVAAKALAIARAMDAAINGVTPAPPPRP